MENKKTKEDSDKWLGELPLQTESESFNPDELIECKNCKRSNPPTRLDCLYCGKEMVFDEVQSSKVKPVLRKIDTLQDGYNLIYLGNLENWSDQQIKEVSKMTQQKSSDIRKVFEAKKTLPIARAETEKETQIVSDRLAEIGVKTKIIKDEMFEMKRISHRLRSLEFTDDKLILNLFNSGENIEIERETITLIVLGAVFEKQVESTVKYKKKNENKLLDRSEISSDEFLIDIFTNENIVSYRIMPKGFDFSFLGDMKKLLAIENVKILIERLQEFAKTARFDDDYVNLRYHLTDIWGLEEETDVKGIERKGFGSFNKQSVTKTNNVNQFTKYSRMHWLLK